MGGVGLDPGDGCVLLGSRQQSRVLATLCAESGKIIRLETLAEEIWPEGETTSWKQTVYTYLTAVRKFLESHGIPGERIAFLAGSGYQIRLEDSDSTDADEFTAHVAAARRCARERDWEGVETRASAARRLWLGAPLGALGGGPILTAFARKLEVSFAALGELEATAFLEQSRNAEAIERLLPLIAENPFQEVLREKLMLAQYRIGDRNAPLETYRAYCAQLDDELGLLPGEGIKELHQKILQGGIV